ncbi:MULTISPECIES: FAD-dependent oxidoreductase [Streptomyces]|uniref:Gamma-glutamylputrescine oxidoreductase n=1 Tax=Streptomyces rubrolavendulae TaxID=285473 RepID=A0A1D8FVV9_9ACTN|nr:FAD-dependent oxidoreductase [Streptomyces rubrolavendulae]AOT57344.1 Gamma-glutamylputrescine oxidoreductase [Streptomyces rubrolavendulae]
MVVDPLSGSLWMEYDPGPARPALEGAAEAEVAVVGGGVAGLCTAWELARAGHRVVLLEADRIATGVTGHTTAKLSALHGRVYAEVRSVHGARAARLYAHSQQLAVERVAEVSEELGIDCDLERLPAFTYTEDPGQVDALRAEADAALEAGLPASFTTRTPLPFPVAGAVRLEGQAQFHPRKYLLGLAADLERLGGRIHERTRVTRLREGSPCRLTTDRGATVDARHVVVATHYPVFDRSLLFTRLEPKRELVVAGPVPADLDPGGVFLTEEGGTRSVRTAPTGDPGRRLLVVTGEKFTPGTAEEGEVGERYARLERWARERFGPLEVTHRWATQDNWTTDRVPYVGRLHPGARHVYVATGFAGWGMSGGVMAGALLAARVRGREPAWTSLYDPVRLRPLREVPAMLRLQAQVAKHFVGDRAPGAYADSVAEVRPGQGAVVRVGGRLLAVHRDEAGGLHAVSARCTHLGCVVHFNDGERAWECPCHGSRFDVSGRVLEGPATRPLERERVEDAADGVDDVNGPQGGGAGDAGAA